MFLFKWHFRCHCCCVCVSSLLTESIIVWNVYILNHNHLPLFKIKSSCLSSIIRGVVAQSTEPEAHVLCVWAFLVELEFRSAGFWGEGKTSQSRERTSNKLGPHNYGLSSESNPGHIGGRQVLSPLHQPCSYWSIDLLHSTEENANLILTFGIRGPVHNDIGQFRHSCKDTKMASLHLIFQGH